MNFNQLTLVGFIGRDSETKTLKSGRQVTKFSVATKESWKAANGEWQEATEWHQVVVIWNRTIFQPVFLFEASLWLILSAG